jgi:hypothetical protein
MYRQRLSLLALALLLAVPVFAQKFTASIRGTVTDPTEAAVSGAKVTLANEETGLSRTVSTNPAGNYSFADLPVGSYRVEVELAGFKTAVRSKVVINVADVRDVNIRLDTGAVTETVSVEANPNAVKTVGAEIAGLISGEQVRELPLNGRNFLQLTLLQPGVTADEGLNTRDKGLAGGANISVSGGSITSNLWLIDGADNVDHGSNRTILVYPSVDAIEEFKIQRNNYGAEFGGAGGGQINLVTRGGTNSLHGSAYYYVRRDALNSTDYFLKKAGKDTAALHWDDFGATLGGPIIKDKLHFFLSYEKNQDKRQEVRSAFVPTAAERNGDFSAANGTDIAGCTPAKPIDPLTGQRFPGDKIPANRLSPAGQALFNLVSLPNVDRANMQGCNNWVQAVDAPVDWQQLHARMDWSLTNSTRVMVRYTQDSWKATNANQGLWGDDPFPIVGSNWEQPGRSLVAQLNQTLGSSMTNTLTFSYSANVINVTRGGDNPEIVQQINALIPTLYPSAEKERKGESQPMVGFGTLGAYAGGGPLWNQAPWKNNQDLFVIKDDYSAVFGSHFIKAGVLYSYNKKNEEPANASQESVQFNGAAGYLGPNGYMAARTTGNALSDLLLSGMVWNTAEIQSNKSVEQRWSDLEFYVADSIKLSPRLTADIGLRASHLTPSWEASDRYANFDPATANAAYGTSPCNGMTYAPGKNPCPALGLAGGSEAENRYLVPTKLLYFGPRVGLAWDVFGTGKTSLRGGFGIFYQRERVSPGLGIGQNPPLTGVGAVTRTLESNQPVVGQVSASYGAPGNALEQKAANSHNYQWNASLQHEILKNTVLEVAYVGNRGVDLVGQVNLNEIAPENRAQFARSNAASLRPLNGVGSIGNNTVALWTHGRDSIYHGLQTSITSRFGQGSVLSLAYTWSKVLTNTGISNADGPGLSVNNAYTDSTHPELDRARGGTDRTHMFSGSLVLALPKLDNKGFLVKNVLGDWQVTTIVQAGTGYPVTVNLAVPGLTSLSGTGNATERPDRIVDQPCTISTDSETQWLNPAAFSINGRALGTNGNASRFVCNGPGIFQADASLYKNVHLGPRVTVQLRFEVFNIFNTVNFQGNSLAATYTAQNIVYDTGNAATATRVISADAPGNFGQLNAARDPRTMQLGVRLTF